MKCAAPFAAELLVVVTLAACTALSPTPAQTSTDDLAEEAAIRALVEQFGNRLASVPLLSPDASDAVRDQYGEYVSPALLDTWLSDLSAAPGRVTSSPWPDRIEIRTLNKEASDRYVLTGIVVELTSWELVNGGAAAKISVTIVVGISQGRWAITEYTETP